MLLFLRCKISLAAILLLGFCFFWAQGQSVVHDLEHQVSDHEHVEFCATCLAYCAFEEIVEKGAFHFLLNNDFDFGPIILVFGIFVCIRYLSFNPRAPPVF